VPLVRHQRGAAASDPEVAQPTAGARGVVLGAGRGVGQQRLIEQRDGVPRPVGGQDAAEVLTGRRQ
jgi:glucokinase